MNDPDDNIRDDDDDDDDGDWCNDHRQGPRQLEETVSDVDATYGLSSADEYKYSASCESPQSDGRKTGPKKLKSRHRRLLQKYDMMSPSSTDEIEVSTSPAGIWLVAEDASKAPTALVELSAMGKSVKYFMSTKSEEERESRVVNVRLQDSLISASTNNYYVALKVEAIAQDDERMKQMDAQV